MCILSVAGRTPDLNISMCCTYNSAICWSKREDRTCCEAIGHDLLSATPILRLLKQGQDTDHMSVTFLITMVKAAVEMSHDATGH